MTTVERIDNYLQNGGLFNPEMMDHEKVKNLLVDCRAEIEKITGLLRRESEVFNSACDAAIDEVQKMREEGEGDLRCAIACIKGLKK